MESALRSFLRLSSCKIALESAGGTDLLHKRLIICTLLRNEGFEVPLLFASNSPFVYQLIRRVAKSYLGRRIEIARDTNGSRFVHGHDLRVYRVNLTLLCVDDSIGNSKRSDGEI
jgi:hypothetical protein